MNCPEVERIAELSLDGETDPTEQVELDAHLSACPTCRERYSVRSAYQSQLREKLRASSDELQAPMALRSQVCTTLRIEEGSRPGRLGSSGRAVAACLAVATVGGLSLSFTKSSPGLSPEESVVKHSKNLPPEITTRGDEVDKVHRFFRRNLRYPINVPRPRQRSVRLVGARLSNISNRDAAYVMYDDRGARISLFAYPNVGRLAPPRHFKRRRVRGRPVVVGKHRGYNVVAWKRGDVAYNLVSDVDSNELIELVDAVDQDNP